MTAIADAAVEEAGALGGELLEQANIICYNTSANLCDCLGGRVPSRTTPFREGLAYARKALWLRDHLGKGPGSKAMAVWAIGKHEQSLGRMDEAKEAFQQCLALETAAADGSDNLAEISPDAPAGDLIAAGYLALMERDPDLLSGLWSR